MAWASKEVLVYRNEQELLDKVRYYLSYSGEAEKARQAGHERVLRDHAHYRRFQILFSELGPERR